MRLIARPNRLGFDVLMIVAAVLSLVLAACNNGSRPGY
jgi:hypothetical protein